MGPGRRSVGSKQQHVLIRKLCLAHEAEVITNEALQMYADLFSRLLTNCHVAAILALFGWEASALPLQEEAKEVDGRHYFPVDCGW